MAMVAVVMATSGEVTFKDCTKAGAIANITSVDINPNLAVIGQNLTVVGHGQLFKTVNVGSTVSMVTSYDGLPVYKMTSDACKDAVVPLPFKMGELYVEAVKCPQAPGPLNYVEKSILNVRPPPGTYAITATASNSDGAEIFCVEIAIKF
jgi:hypothetical protein